MPVKAVEHEATLSIAIPQPAFRRVIAIAAIVFFLAVFAILPFKLGCEGFLESLTYFSATWLVILMFTPPIALFAWLAFPPLSSLSRLEVSQNTIHIVPGRIARWLAETPVEIALTDQSKEILLCHELWQGLADGFRLVVRARDGAEREIRATPMDYLNARDAQVLVTWISASTGLPALLLARRRQADGTVQETSWNPPSRRVRLTSGAALSLGALPFIGGAVMGSLSPAPGVIVAIGLGLWLSQMGVLFLLTCGAGARKKFPVPYSLTTIFTFAAAYGLAVVAVGLIFRGR
jgi:hypothetical protein